MSVAPLRATLKELEQATLDQLDLICAVRANILHNDDKIEKMLLHVAHMDPHAGAAGPGRGGPGPSGGTVRGQARGSVATAAPTGGIKT